MFLCKFLTIELYLAYLMPYMMGEKIEDHLEAVDDVHESEMVHGNVSMLFLPSIDAIRTKVDLFCN